jgi:glycosyltransferase involved in cell wall biosynthesis
MSDFVMSIKQLLRPLIPDALMAKYRVRQHSLAMRTNVDVFVSSDREARRWIRLTPDTYRVVTGFPRADQSEPTVFVGAENDGLGAMIGFDGIDVVVAGATLSPSMRALKVVEPRVVPRTIVSTPAAFEEIGGVEENSADLTRTYQRLADAGYRIGLVPRVVDRLPVVDREPIAIPAAVVFAAVPLHDIGGGSRAAQLAFELLASGFHVTYVAMYPSAEGVELGLRYLHPMLEQYTVETFEVDDLSTRSDAGIVILEAPAEPFVEPARMLQDRGWKIVYDIIDDWTDASLGGFWYKPEVEDEIVEMSDAVVASAPDLVQHGIDLGKETTLIPNAVNSTIFGPIAPDAPADLPDREIIGYAGSLYGDWFDWDALRSVAMAFPESSVVVIGDDHYKRPMPSNVVYLGLKPHADLPAYVQRFDVGIVPFVVSDVTHAVSPLKVYEYLASGVPVAAPPLRALDGLDGVVTHVDLVEAVRVAKRAPKPDRDLALVRHSWHNRLERLVRAIGMDLPHAAGAKIRTVRRTPVHYDRKDRWVRA